MRRGAALVALWLGLAVAAQAVAAVPPRAAAPAGALRLVFGGDVMFGREVAATLRPAGGADPFAALAPLFAAADFALVNLETPLCAAPADVPAAAATAPGPAPAASALGGPPPSVPPAAPAGSCRATAPRFRAPPAHAARLAAAGIDAVTLANNHALDAGPDGLAETVRALAAAQVAVAGVRPAGCLGASAAGAAAAAPAATDPCSPFAPLRRTVRGVQLAVLAATDRYNVGAPGPPAAAQLARLPTATLHRQLPALVRAVAEDGRSDVLIVSLHWGTEFAARPSAAERRLAHALIDAGALVVVGHHPHVLQPAERRGRGLILYSLGNLVCDMRDPRAALTALVTVTLARDAAGRFAVADSAAHAFAFAGRERGPRPATPAEAAAVRARLRGL